MPPAAAASRPARRRGRRRSPRPGAARRRWSSRAGSCPRSSRSPPGRRTRARPRTPASSRATAVTVPAPTPREPLRERRRGGPVPIPDRHPAGPGIEAREHDRVGRTARPGDDDVRTGQRPAHRHLHPDPEPRRVRVEADQPAIVCPDARCSPRRSRAPSASTSSTRPATSGLYGAVTPSPRNSGPRAAATAPGTSASSSSARTYSRVDPRRRERGVVHDHASAAA